MTVSRILICGGRDYTDAAQFADTMAVAQKWFSQNCCIIEGGAKGADAMARNWAKANGKPCLTIEPNWSVYGLRAGMVRNTWMLVYGLPDLVIAFPGGIGTADMIRQTEKSKIALWRI